MFTEEFWSDFDLLQFTAWEKGLHVLFRYTERQGLDPQSDQDISFWLNVVIR